MTARKPWQRTGPDRRIRGSAGQRMRERRLARTDGLCEMCDAEGRVTLATVVDHVIPLAKGGADEDGNTRNLCDAHHQVVTAEQFGHQRQVAIGACGVDGMPSDPRHPWNSPKRT